MSTEQHSPVTFDLDALHALRFSRPRDMVSVQRFTQRLGYTTERLEELAHVRPGLAHENPFHTRIQHFMRIALDVVAWRMLSVPDLDGAIEWFKHEPLAEHGDQTAEQLVADGHHHQLMKLPIERHN